MNVSKQVVPSVPVSSQRSGSHATLEVSVSWTDPNRQRTTAVGRHDVYLLAVDRDRLRLQGGQRPHSRQGPWLLVFYTRREAGGF